MFITGRAALIALVGLVAVIVLPNPLTVLAWAALVVALLVIDVALATSPRLVTVSRSVPRQVRLTQPATSVLTITNGAGRTLRGRVRDAWVPSAGASDKRQPIVIPAGETRRVTTPLLPWRRGERQADRVTLRSVGPMRLAGRQVSLDVPASIRVLPEFRSRRHLPSRLARLREMDGRAAVQIRGQGTEFDSLREYAIGDDVRSIDWRATARAERVVVRTWRPERDRRVAIVVDCSRLAAVRVGDEVRLDAALDAALLLAALAGHAGDRVELIAADRQIRAHVGPVAGAQILPTFANALAPLEPRLIEMDWSRVAATLRQSLSQRALVALITPLEPAAIEAGLLPALPAITRRHQVVIASAADPLAEQLRTDRSDAERVFDAAAAERGEIERQAAIRLVKTGGTEVIHEPPEKLAPALADTYLALKAAGRL